MKPNILFLLTDDQRYDTIAALGNSDIITPHMDALVKDGTACTNAYIEGGYTGAVCMPSRCMIHTAKHLSSLYNLGEDVPKEDTTLGEALQAEGYYTYGMGKWHNGTSSFTRSFNQGDSIFFGGMWDHWNVPMCHYDPSGVYEHTIRITPHFFEQNKTLRMHCDTLQPGVHSTDILAKTAVDFITNYDSQKPFFCYTAFLAPHDPRTMPEKYLEMYKHVDIQLPDNCTQTYPVAYDGKDTRDEDLTPYPRSLERTKEELREYYAMITHLDDKIGEIIQALKEKNLYDNTIIVLCGDNGLGVGSHGFMGKQNTYEHSIKVPLILRGPGIPRGAHIPNRLFLTDIYPTLCELVGAKIPSSVESNSFASLLNPGESLPREDKNPMYFIIMNRVRALRYGPHKLSVYIPPQGDSYSVTLHNIESDPLELDNLVKKEPALAKELMQKLLDMRELREPIDRDASQVFWGNYSKLQVQV